MASAPGALESIRTSVRYLGWQRTLARVVSRVARRLTGYQAFVCASHSTKTRRPGPSGEAEQLDYHFLDADEIARAAEDPANELGPRFLREARAAGYECCGAFEGDTLVAYIWFACTPSRLLGDLYFSFSSQCVYLLNGFTRPSHRGKRINHHINVHAARAFAARGRPVCVTIVAARNYTSLRSMEPIGYQRCGVIRIVGFGRRRLVFHSRACTELSLRLAPGSAAAAT